MRDERQPVAGGLAAQHLSPQHDEPRVLEHPHLAAVLALVRRRRPLEGERRRLVDGPPPALHHEVREREVVPEAGIDLGVVGAAQRVDRAVAGRDRAEPRLSVPRHELVAPVDAFLVRAVRGLEPEAPADVRDVRVGEVADELAQRVGRPRRVRVGEGDDVGVGRAHRGVLRRDLAAARVPDHARAGRLRERLGAVRGSVGGDDELEQLRRIVERAKVLDPPLDRVLLVVRGHDHRDGREVPVVERDALRADARRQRNGGRVERVRPGERGKRAPEEDDGHDHGRNASAAAARSGERPDVGITRTGEREGERLPRARRDGA